MIATIQRSTKKRYHNDDERVLRMIAIVNNVFSAYQMNAGDIDELLHRAQKVVADVEKRVTDKITQAQLEQEEYEAYLQSRLEVER